MPKKSKKLILIDGNAIIHRAYHALPPLTTKKGELVNAVYGFASTLLKVIDKFQPDYIAASFDLKGPTFRHKKFKDYKATRVKAPDELYAQIPKVKEVTEAFNIPIYEKKGFEADDVIGTVSWNMKHKAWNKGENIEVIIVTGDLDALQLVNDKTKVYTMRRGINDSVLYDEEKVKERYGLKPEQLKDFKGLRGDASDNIPGVKGIGEKTAANLLQKYGTLEKVYQNLNEIKRAVKDKLERDKAIAILSKNLGTIKTDMPIDFDLQKCATRDFDRAKVARLFQKLNFFSLIKRLPDTNSQTNMNDTNASVKIGGVRDLKYEIIKGAELEKFIEELKRQKEFSLSLKLNSGGKISGIAFSRKTGRASYILWNEKSKVALKNILENERIKKIGYDLKAAYKLFKKEKIILRGIRRDIMLMQYVLAPGEKIELEKMVLEELGEEIEKKGKRQLTLGIGIEDEKEIIFKNCQKADYIFKLKSILQNKIEKISAEQNEKRSLEYVFEKIEMPLVEILAEMELAGVKINPLILKGISEKITTRINNLEKSICNLSGGKFNVNSPGQLAEVLFVKLKLPTDGIKKIKTGFSTAAAELEKLRDRHKIIEKVENYRELFKLKTTYLDALPKLIGKDSRIHTTFNQAVTATGRLSSENPNLQNIPIRTDIGKLIRAAFEAEDGFVFVSADYSQIDLRVMAHMSGDKKLIETFMAGEDVHRTTAAEVNKVSLSQVTEKMRSAAKALNFGIIYGISAFGFARSAKIDRDEAKEFISQYLEKFPQVAEFIKNTKEFTRKNGYAETETGRRRYLPEINSPNFQVAGAAERMAINMPIQGLAADIMKLAMIDVTRELGISTNYEFYETTKPPSLTLPSKRGGDVKMILQIHDEIILEARENMAKEVAEKVKEIMENVYKLKVPLIVDVKIGDNWGEL